MWRGGGGFLHKLPNLTINSKMREQNTYELNTAYSMIQNCYIKISKNGADIRPIRQI